MNDGNHPKRLLVGGVNDEVITHKQKSQRSGREIRPGVTGLRKRDRRANCREDFFNYAIGSVDAVSADVLPNFVEIR